MEDIIKNPALLFIATFAIFTSAVIIALNNRKWYVVIPCIMVGIPTFPLIGQAVLIQYISEYGRNIPDVDERKVVKTEISSLVFKQDDDGEYHYSFMDEFGISTGTDIDNGYDLDIRFIEGGKGYAEYEIRRYTYRDWAQPDRIKHSIKLKKIYIPSQAVEIFND